MTHSGDQQPIVVYPITDLTKELRDDHYAELLCWLRAHGIEPHGVPIGERLEIGHVIDFWWWAVRSEPNPDWPVLERHLVSGEPARSHHQVQVHTLLPDHLAEALRSLQSQVEDRQASIEAQLAAAGILPSERGDSR